MPDDMNAIPANQPEKLSIKEIADEIGAKKATVRTRIMRAGLWPQGEEVVRQMTKKKEIVRVWSREVLAPIMQ